MTTKYTVTCTYVDHCFPDYLTDHRGILVGIEGGGQTAAEIAREAAKQAIDSDEMPEGVTVEQLTAAALGELDDTAKFWPVDADGNDITDDDVEGPEEQPCYWFRFAVTAESTDDTTFTLEQRTEMSHAFDRGNYAHAYETTDLAQTDVEDMAPHERAAFILGFFGMHSLDEIGSDREAYDEAYFSPAGRYVVEVAKYTDDRTDEYAADENGDSRIGSGDEIDE